MAKFGNIIDILLKKKTDIVDMNYEVPYSSDKPPWGYSLSFTSTNLVGGGLLII